MNEGPGRRGPGPSFLLAASRRPLPFSGSRLYRISEHLFRSAEEFRARVDGGNRDSGVRTGHQRRFPAVLVWCSSPLSADSITRIGFGDEAVRHMPYVRSSLDFADLDAKIRARSAGRRTLDEVMRELFECRAHGESLNHDVWMATVARVAGPQARAEFEHLILLGSATLVPAPNAFGPCFTRRSTGEAVVNGVRRAQGYEWVRVATVPDSACRTWGESHAPRALIARRPAIARTSRVGVFGGVRVPYTATVQLPNGGPAACVRARGRT